MSSSEGGSGSRERKSALAVSRPRRHERRKLKAEIKGRKELHPTLNARFSFIYLVDTVKALVVGVN